MNDYVNELNDLARQVVGDQGIAADEAATWDLIAELGWLMVSTPESQGGLGMGLAGACALHRELGRGLARVPFLPAVLAVEAVGRGSMPGSEQWLERMTSGAAFVTASLGQSGLELSGTGDSLQLSGRVEAVPSVDRASHILACTSDGACLALVALDQDGVAVTPRATWDETRRLYDVELSAVPLDPALLIARGSEAQNLAQRLETLRDFGLAADAVGGATATLDMTVEYLQTRQQFGRPLAMFQALKHRCADLKAMTEAAEALLLDSIGRIGDWSEDEAAQASEAGRAAKLLACSAFAAVAEESLQLHGGIGMTEEHDCHLFLKRAMLNEHLGRPADCYETHLAEQLLAASGD